MNRKVKSLKQLKQRLYLDSVRCQKLQVFEMQSFGLDTGAQHCCFGTRLLHCQKITLFEVSLEIRCSGVASRYRCYGNHAAGSKPI